MSHGRIGIALSGGELAGTVHIGVLFALEDLGIRPDVIAGTSAGALIASLYAHGYTFDEFRRAVKKFPGLRLFDYAFPLVSSLMNQVRHSWLGSNVPVPKGILRGERLRRYIKRMHQNRLLKMPLYIIATDLYTTKAIAFTNEETSVNRGYANRSTDLYREIEGSCSIPGFFTPVRHRQWMLVDGAIRDQVPVSILRQAGCEKIFAVNVLKLPQDWYPITIIDVLNRSLATLIDETVITSDVTGKSVFSINPTLKVTSWWGSRDPMIKNIELGYRFILDKKRDIEAFLDSVN